MIFDGGNRTLHWRGHMIWKNPIDLFMYAEIAHEVKPDLVIETGTHSGGSALYWLDMLRLSGVEDARVLSVDVEIQEGRPEDPSLLYFHGDSASKTFFRWARKQAAGRKVLVNLDSEHTYDHVRKELLMLSPLVSSGSYLIVEDGIDDIRWGIKGALAATKDFLAKHPKFSADRHRERYGLSNCPEGYLLRA